MGLGSPGQVEGVGWIRAQHRAWWGGVVPMFAGTEDLGGGVGRLPISHLVVSSRACHTCPRTL